MRLGKVHTFHSISIYTTKLVHIKEATDNRFKMAFVSSETGKLFLLEDGT